MRCTILHENKGRMRVSLGRSLSMEEADMALYHLRRAPGVIRVDIHDRTGCAIIRFNGSREIVVDYLARLSFVDEEIRALVPEHTGRAINRLYEDMMLKVVMERFVNKFLVPPPLSYIITAIKSVKYIKAALKSLWNRKVDVSVLDGTSITAAMLMKDFDTAGSIMFLLSLGEILEEWTHKKSVDNLAQAMALNVDKVWKKEGDKEVLTDLNSLSIGDVVIAATGNTIPVDGKVIFGEAVVNQASITGEPIGVAKYPGTLVYAGTAIEEGSLQIEITEQPGSGRYDRIVAMIEESERLKSETENKASNLADKLVPYSLLGTLVTWLITRNMMKAMSILMVDFSCALKLAMPITVLSAMRECGNYKITAKGGKFLEAVAQADTIVFDKTGTLTHAMPKVKELYTFGDYSKEEILRMAACLEEHFPHSMARAVVEAANEAGLDHEERHTKVEYIVAHGISSYLDGEKILIGSHHFIFDDEHVKVKSEEDRVQMEEIPDQYSKLYMAIGGELVAVIAIEDPLREEAGAVITTLRSLGIKKFVMMTGDNLSTAKSVGEKLGIDEIHAEVLPEDKASYIREEKEKGRKVIMIGDGINDSPALSEAHVGIAISTGAAIAREVSDITITDDDLFQLVTLRSISMALMRRIKTNYNTIMGFNGGLILAGVLGLITPTTSALLHNVSTLAISSKSMTDLLD